ncbi:RBM8 family RNA-binding protein [Sporobolomyces koalae]|uniref:RBM8 family RNA-binding protein n=1 Tax=Sporobolomyces koalae TaxID=500713 RepID=UPI003174B81F
MQSDRMDVEAPSDASVKRKGRGHSSKDGEPVEAKSGAYQGIDTAMDDTASNAQRSVEGWIVIVTGVHEEASEEDVMDRFSDYGDVKNLHLNLDRRTGYVKGYALVEYETREEAEKAISQAPQEPLLEQQLSCDFAFVRPPVGTKEASVTTRPAAARGRSASPARKPLVTRID